MLPDVFAGLCLQIEIPDWIPAVFSKAVVALKWLYAEIPNDGQTLASVVFALNAGFASIDSFTQGIMGSLKESLQKRLVKYNGEWKNPVGADNTGSNLKLREVVNNIAEDIVSIQTKLPVTFGKTVRFWKWIMGLCAAGCLVLMAIPYCARLILILALPVPLFSFACHLKKYKIKKHILQIDLQYDLLTRPSVTPENTDAMSMLDRIGNLEQEVSRLVTMGSKKQAKPKVRKPRQTKK